MNETIQIGKFETLRIPQSGIGEYFHPEYNIDYSTSLVRDEEGKLIADRDLTVYRAMEILDANGCRLPTAEEIRILNELGSDHRIFDDRFGRTEGTKYRFKEWTCTQLVKPEGSDIKKGRKYDYHLRIVKEAGKEVGEVWIPHESGIVREWSDFGLPAEVEKFEFIRMKDEHKDKIETHFVFNPDHHEIAIFSDYSACVTPISKHVYYKNLKCFMLNAYVEHDYSPWLIGMRPVKGPLPSHEKMIVLSEDDLIE